jgi:ubiquinone/menaquinone biosynthesis C-methylase UbiE
VAEAAVADYAEFIIGPAEGRTRWLIRSTKGWQKMTGADERPYFLGHSDVEIERLALQNDFYREATENALRRAGLAQGMRVLDIGSGGGDVSLIAAELVGPSGFVLGLDRSPDAVAAAGRRVEQAGIAHVRFVAAEFESFAAEVRFDALIGRFVLMYLSDPAATLRVLMRQLRPDALVVFQEMEMRAARAYPEGPLFARCIDWYASAIERAGFESGMGGKLFATFQKAGLLAPQAAVAGRLEGGPHSPGYALMAANVRTMLPMLLQQKVVSAAEVGLETLADRLRQEALEGGRCLMFPLLISAWARVADADH